MTIVMPHGKGIELVEGDITIQTVDAIVNAANTHLLPGGGVCGAIHGEGGPTIARECRDHVLQHGPVPTGSAAITTAGDLPARFVIHAVGPVWHGGQQGEPDMLTACYHQAIRLADTRRLQSIAFPSISTGIYGYPLSLAAPVALAAIKSGLVEANHLKLARLVLYGAANLAAYLDAADASQACPRRVPSGD